MKYVLDLLSDLIWFMKTTFVHSFLLRVSVLYWEYQANALEEDHVTAIIYELTCHGFEALRQTHFPAAHLWLLSL